MRAARLQHQAGSNGDERHRRDFYGRKAFAQQDQGQQHGQHRGRFIHCRHAVDLAQLQGAEVTQPGRARRQA